jgi:dihydroorotase
MQLLLKNVRIVEMDSVEKIHEFSLQDIFIKDGKIEEIGQNLNSDAKTTVWDCQGAVASPAWMDVGIQTGDPGFEHREDLQSAAAAAAAGGFTAVACFPNTNPAIHSKTEVLYVKNSTSDSIVDFFPIGAVSQNCEGKDLAELFDMFQSGAVAFSDGRRPVQDSGLLLRAMDYAKAFNGLIFNHPNLKTIASGGQMHEGLVSTTLGLKGLPSIAEDVMVQRDLSLSEYAGARLHIHLISTKKSVDMIRAAKKAGLPITASVAIANLCFTDEKLTDFDTNWKVLPPLRQETDRKALLKGVEDGTIDFICSNHNPQDIEAKNLEFTYAEFGMSGLETALALSCTYLLKKISLSELIKKWAIQPRKILGLPIPKIEKGALAELTIFQPEQSFTFLEKNLQSKSANSPLFGTELKGKVLGIVNGKKYLKLPI